jgi:hypothetical protein
MEEQIQAPARTQMTSRQRNTMVICKSLANDMGINGTVAEHHTAALLQLVADALVRGYEAELVRVARAWRRELEAEGKGRAGDG